MKDIILPTVDGGAATGTCSLIASPTKDFNMLEYAVHIGRDNEIRSPTVNITNRNDVPRAFFFGLAFCSTKFMRSPPSSVAVAPASGGERFTFKLGAVYQP
jgi:hypothetical protein